MIATAWQQKLNRAVAATSAVLTVEMPTVAVRAHRLTVRQSSRHLHLHLHRCFQFVIDRTTTEYAASHHLRVMTAGCSVAVNRSCWWYWMIAVDHPLFWSSVWSSTERGSSRSDKTQRLVNRSSYPELATSEVPATPRSMRSPSPHLSRFVAVRFWPLLQQPMRLVVMTPTALVHPVPRYQRVQPRALHRLRVCPVWHEVRWRSGLVQSVWATE